MIWMERERGEICLRKWKIVEIRSQGDVVDGAQSIRNFLGMFQRTGGKHLHITNRKCVPNIRTGRRARKKTIKRETSKKMNKTMHSSRHTERSPGPAPLPTWHCASWHTVCDSHSGNCRTSLVPSDRLRPFANNSV